MVQNEKPHRWKIAQHWYFWQPFSRMQIRKPRLSASKKVLRGNNRQTYSGSGCQKYSVKGIRLCTCRIIGGFTGLEMADVWIIYQVVCENNRNWQNLNPSFFGNGLPSDNQTWHWKQHVFLSVNFLCSPTSWHGLNLWCYQMTNTSFATTHSLIARNTKRTYRHWYCHLPAVGGYILFFPITCKYFC